MGHRGWLAALVGAGVFATLPTLAEAVPIVYVATLQDGVVIAGVNNQDPVPGSYEDPDGATYYRFQATAGNLVTVTGQRQDGFYDMAFWIYSGTYADTDDFGPIFDFTPDFIEFGDDDLPPALPGPHGDPEVSFNAPNTGWYTIAVTNFLSDPGELPNHFTLVANGIDDVTPPEAVPEPGTILLLGAGISGIVAKRRRRS